MNMHFIKDKLKRITGSLA